MNLIDKNFVKVQFNKGLESYANEASVQEYMAQKLMDELCVACDRPFGHIFEVGSGTGFLTYRIIEKLQFDNLTVNDIAKTSKQKVQELEKVYKMTIPFIEGDAEDVDFPHQLDAVISGSTIQWFKNIPAFFNKVAHSLQPNGLLAFSTFGCHNYKEIKALTGVGLDYLCMSEICTLLRPKYTILFSQEWTEVKEFSHPLEVLRHMKHTGVNGVRKTPLGIMKLNDFIRNYGLLFTNQDQKVTLTYHPMIIIAKKK
ncbi:malonyl-CoA O-methyltransferase BioC [Saccharicrinis fermentans DSM 9555 = JCM 21142]|uniref:Malonyl-CoA O-methyltransferase BioC n=2 Tax=Saccharicrinis fermentans TaxID=982 RepID=W7YIZ9_9BACT|nr:malonyl-CoA O-methyltransferase BioC [Saccharicrinis fermentans DSM 9555 = JCM 21142]